MTEKHIFQDDSVLGFFTGERSLISSSVKAFHIYILEDTLTLDIDLELQYAKNHRNFRLRFLDVLEYSFYHNSNHYFYNVVNPKFFKIDESYYISLDPDESCKIRSETDNDFALAEKLQAFEL